MAFGAAPINVRNGKPAAVKETKTIMKPVRAVVIIPLAAWMDFGSPPESKNR